MVGVGAVGFVRIRRQVLRAIGILLCATVAALSGAPVAYAQCTLPYTLANGPIADATQLMANFNALANCVKKASPANSIQYNAGGSNLSGVGPLTNGQILVGSTGNVPQMQALIPGAGISIANSAGSIKIAASVGGGLYRQVLSPTPTSSGTSLTTWLNQGMATVADSTIGMRIDAPTSGTSTNIAARYKSAPAAPYTIRALVAATRNSTHFSNAGIGWYDGSSKLHTISFSTNNGASPIFQVNKYNSPTAFNSLDFASTSNAFSQPIWLQIMDDGTNISFGLSQDGANFLQVFSVAKSSGFLGASGYSNVLFYISPQGGRAIGTLMSWTES